MLPGVEFEIADLRRYTPGEGVGLLFSNAVFQWVPSGERVEIMKRLLGSLGEGGVLAFQVPDNFEESSHVLMRETAREFQSVPGMDSAARDKFQSPETLYNELMPLCSHVDIWHTHYNHVLSDHEAIVEWVKGTGLRPFLDLLDQDGKGRFLEKYLGLLRGERGYRGLVDGKVMLRYPRLFVVAVRK